MKQSLFNVGRMLTPEEWGGLKAWRAANPEQRWKQGEAREDGLRFWQYAKNSRDGEKWVTADVFEAKRAATYEANAKWRLANPEKASDRSTRAVKKWRAENPELARATAREYQRKKRAQNPGRAREWAREWAKKNPDKVRESRKKTRAKTRDKAREYERNITKTNPLAALARRVRCRTAGAFRDMGYKKTSKTAELLGCSWDELVKHVESQFHPGMMWSNRSLWHLDHIIPLASAKTEEELVALCHYTNIQPLWALDNFRKSNRMPGELLG